MRTSKLKKIVTLRQKKLSNGNISLYLDYYRNNKRVYEFLKLYIKEKPRNAEEKEQYDSTLVLANEICKQRENDYKHKDFGIDSPVNRNANFIDFYQKYHSEYKKADKRMILSSLNAFCNFLGTEDPFLKPSMFTEDLVRKFKDYLLENYNGATPGSYFKRFKKVVKAAVKSGFLPINPTLDVVCSEPEVISKEILSENEIKLLAKTKCGNETVKRAFLFSLFTGLRFCDVNTIQFKNYDQENKQIKFLQNKVKGHSKKAFNIVDLNETAIKLIGDITDKDDLIFSLPSYAGCSHQLKRWTKAAGITKNITWHSARHSFATILLIHKNDIRTVGALLGHSRLQHTQKYTHIIDEVKKTAVNSMLSIDLD